MYKYTDPHITCSPILTQCSRLFSENKRMCGSAFRKAWCPLLEIMHEEHPAQNVGSNDENSSLEKFF